MLHHHAITDREKNSKTFILVIKVVKIYSVIKICHMLCQLTDSGSQCVPILENEYTLAGIMENDII